MSDTPEKLDLESKDLIAEKLEQLEQLFPNLVTEGENGKVLDLDQLKNEFSTEVVEGTKERYRLEWPGKKEAIVTANLPTTKTLRPVKEDSVDWDNTENLYIEGDNLEVLKILQESYFGKIKMIYIDPPYNTGKDFVYKDNFSKNAQEELEESGQKDEYNQRLFQNADTSGRYHSDWLSMMYPRLKLARNLLKDDGVLFISIDDNEVTNLKKLCDDVFGENSFIVSLAVQLNPRGRHLDNFVARTHENLLVYGKDVSLDSVMTGLEKEGSMESEYNETDERGAFRRLGLRNRNQAFNPRTRPKLFYPLYVDPKTMKVSLEKDLVFTEEALPETTTGVQTCWTWGKDKVSKEKDLLVGAEINGVWQVFRKDYLYNSDGKKALTLVKSLWTDKTINNDYGKKAIKSLFGNNVMDFPKSPDLIKKLVQCGSASKDVTILDFFSGSATTAQAVLQLNAEDGGNRKHIMVQLPEVCDEKSAAYKAGYKNICEIGKKRILQAGAKIKEETGADIDYGFRVYRLDESNMADVYHTPQDYDQNKLELFADNVKPDRTADDLLAQIMLDWGLPLSLPIEEAEVEGKRVFHVAGNSLLACFEEGIDEDFAKAIAKVEPLRIVFKDAGFASDTAKSNVKQLLKQLSPETEMKVI